MAVVSSGAGSGILPASHVVSGRENRAHASSHELLDQVQGMLISGQVSAGMELLMSRLSEMRRRYGAEEWDAVLGVEVLNHPIGRLIWQDPFTDHSFRKPRGYSGDAQLLDYIYGLTPAPRETSPLGSAIFEFNHDRQAPKSVRSRGEILALTIDETAARVKLPRILSVACGHLREAGRSEAVMGGRIGEFIALDQDSESLAEVDRAYASKGVRTVRESVRSILAGKVTFAGLDLVYAAGLYDYLGERVASRLTRMLFDMLAPSGKLLVANFAPCLEDIGYIESFMGWRLIYREPEQMAALARDIGSWEWKSDRLFWDEHDSIVFLELTKRGTPKIAVEFGPGVNGKPKIPGRAKLTLGEGVLSRSPAAGRRRNGGGQAQGR